jgi:superfamily II DNA or RNA helicase
LDASRALVVTRQLGGRGLDFPNASKLFVVSPRSNYQETMQEVARIRSRQSASKTATIVYYADTAEEAKARRLGKYLQHAKYGENALFDVVGVPNDAYELRPYERIQLNVEEYLPGHNL